MMKVTMVEHPSSGVTAIAIIGSNAVERRALRSMGLVLKDLKVEDTFVLCPSNAFRRDELVFSSDFIQLITAKLINLSMIDMERVKKLQLVDSI